MKLSPSERPSAHSSRPVLIQVYILWHGKVVRKMCEMCDNINNNNNSNVVEL